jgi:hypothetical protein
VIVKSASRPFSQGLAGAFLCLVSVGCEPPPLPQPVERWGNALEALVSAPPSLLTSPPPVKLTPGERRSIESLRQRGAHIEVRAGSGDTIVSFPLGALEREWLEVHGELPIRCGMGAEYSFSPTLDGPPMTDEDLFRLLAQLPRLTRVDLRGTAVSANAVATFRTSHAAVEAEHALGSDASRDQ